MSDLTLRRSTRTTKPVFKYGFQQKPITEFHLFPKLPIELRQKIFKEALPPRPKGREGVIHVAIENAFVPDLKGELALAVRFVATDLPNQEFATRYQSVLHSRSDMAIRQVCKEANEVFLSVYKNTLSTAKGKPSVRFEDVTTIMIWPNTQSPSVLSPPVLASNDALNRGYKMAGPESFSSIKKLALFEHIPIIAKTLSKGFPNLEFFGLVRLCFQSSKEPGILDPFKKGFEERAKELGLKDENVAECAVIIIHPTKVKCCELGGKGI